MTGTVRSTLLLERADERPTRVASAWGELLAFSTAAPAKERNEDGALALESELGLVLAVADGMGGQSAADRAASATLKRLVKDLEAPQPSLRSSLLDGIESANSEVLALGVGAGATLACMIVHDGRARAVHVGDAMALHVGQRGRVKSLTISHSPTGYAVEAGLLDEHDALHHAERHLISNHIGMADMRIEVGPSVEIARRDTLLVASDGLADNLTLDEIVGLARSGPLERAALQLAALARARMGATTGSRPSKPDDLTFLLFRRER